MVTSQTSKSTSPSDYVIKSWQAAGLRVPSAFRAFLVTLPRTAVASKMGTLAAPDRAEVVARVKLALELN